MAQDSQLPHLGDGRSDLGRRRFLGYLLAAPTLVSAAELVAGGSGPKAEAAVHSPPQPAEIYDLNDMLTDAARATSNLIRVQVNSDHIGQSLHLCPQHWVLGQ